MKLGVTFPQLEIGSDPAVIRRYAEAAERAGYDYLLTYDHVLGAETTHRPGWTGYTYKDAFHEPFVLFGYLAAVAPTLELVTGVIILPQRQAALVAKQAAEVDLLTGGKLRLGIGVGWNPVEFEALGEDFSTRGRRVEEQIALMRALWTDPVITFGGNEHRITEAGLNPMPIQRPIPVWIGGMSDAAIERTARIADGWFPLGRAEIRREHVAKLHAALDRAGRSHDEVGIDARISINDVPEDRWLEEQEAWRELGATHLAVNTMGVGLSPEGHIEMIQRFMEMVGSRAEW